MQSPPKIRLARTLRKEMNMPERMAWETLRELRHHGFAVRRQHPIGPYIVDFVVLKARLVIEVDGSIHARDDVRARDEIRERKIISDGWRMLRVDAQTAMSADQLLGLVCKELGL